MASAALNAFRFWEVPVETMMSDLPSKPEWIRRVRAFTQGALSGPDDAAYEEVVFVTYALLDYEKSEELGGRQGAKVIRRLGDLKQKLGLGQLPGELGTHGWMLMTF